jgi:cytochrome c553
MKRSLVTVSLFALFGVVGLAQAAGNVAAGKAKAESCAECHGANGEGDEAPKLAGQAQSELARAMEDYKSGKRANSAMKEAMGKLSDSDVENLAAYYASLK